MRARGPVGWIAGSLALLVILSCSTRYVAPTSGGGPNGRAVFAVADSFVGSHIDSLAADTLWVARLDGSAAHSLHIQGSHPAFDPQGEWIGFFRDTFDTSASWFRVSSWLIRRSGSGGVQIPSLDLLGPGSPVRLEWRQDGRQFIDGSLVYRLEDLAVVDTAFVPLGGTKMHIVQWAADTLHYLARSGHDYYVTTVRPRQVVRHLATLSDDHAVLSPDGTKLLASEGGIYVLDLASDPPTKTGITPGPNDSSPRWGSDGRTIFFIRKDGASHFTGFHLYRTSLDAPGYEIRLFDRPVAPAGMDVHLE